MREPNGVVVFKREFMAIGLRMEFEIGFGGVEIKVDFSDSMIVFAQISK